MADTSKPADEKVPIKRIPEGPRNPDLSFDKGRVSPRGEGYGEVAIPTGTWLDRYKKGGKVKGEHCYSTGGKVLSCKKF